MIYTLSELEGNNRYDSRNNPEMFENVPCDSAPCVITDRGKKMFLDKYQPAAEIVILGGGHIGLALSKLSKITGFYITVIDDRNEFANKQRFPEADRVLNMPFSEIHNIEFSDNSYFVIVTNGHLNDDVCLRQVIEMNYSYIGMIGSRKKVDISFKALEKDGVPKSVISQIHAPIGLAIGAKTPAEIAVSILAEIISLKKRGYDCFEVEKEIFENKSSGVLMSVIEKSGSVPCPVGAKAFLRDDNQIFGTIGGGKIEYLAIEKAKNVENKEIVKYNLDNSEAEAVGMVCGGKATVLFERLDQK